VFAASFAQLCTPQCHFDHLAVRLTLGAHQGVPVDIHRGRDLGVAHQLLLHPDRRSGIVQPRPVGVAKGVPPHATVLSCSFPPLFMERQPLTVRRGTVLQAPHAGNSTTLRARHQTASSRTDIVLLHGSRVKVPPGGRTGKEQFYPRVQPNRLGWTIGQGFPGFFFGLELPAQKNRREVRIERKLVFLSIPSSPSSPVRERPPEQPSCSGSRSRRPAIRAPGLLRPGDRCIAPMLERMQWWRAPSLRGESDRSKS
jgi:hypothetical protein